MSLALLSAAARLRVRPGVGGGGGADSLFMAPLYTLPTGLTYNATTGRIDGTVYDTTYAEPTTTVTPVTDQGSRAANQTALQNAIDAATLDTTIVLTAGVDYGKITLKNKTTGSGWIYIVSSARSSLPEGTRVTSADAASLARLRIGTTLGKAVDIEAGAHHYRLVGLDISKDTGVVINNLVYLSLDSGMGTESNQPTDIVIDRCWLNVEDTSNTRTGIRGDVTRFALLDSTIEGLLYPGDESHAFLCVGGAGTQKFINSKLEAASINIMWGGGGDPPIANVLPRNIEIRRCWFPKRLSWNPNHSSYNGTRAAACKNNFEIKAGERFLIEHCVFENCWPEGQNGYAVVLKAVNQNGGGTWVTTQDVTIRGCLARNVYGGFSLAGKPEANAVADRFGRCDIHHVVVDIADPSVIYTGTSNNDHLAWFLANTRPVTIRRTTVSPRVAPSRGLFFAGAQCDALDFVDNIAHYGAGGQPGIRGNGFYTPASPNDGSAVFDAYCAAYTFADNGMWLAGTVAGANLAAYEPANVLEESTSLDAVLPNRTTGDYTPVLAAFATASSTNDMPGADWAAVNAGLTGVTN